MSPDSTNPPAPIPERGRAGEPGADGVDLHGGQGGQGGRGGRGGIGLTGDRGDTGSRGERGQTGPHGDTGLTGNRGATGAQGDPGQTGQTGPSGGERGATGKTGAAGAAGADQDKQSKADKWALAIVVFLCALSSVYFSTQAIQRLNNADDEIRAGAVARTAIKESAARYKDQIDCQQQITEQTILALKARSTFAENQAQSTLVLDQAQQVYLNVVGTVPQPAMADLIAAFRNYQKALDFNIQATQESLRVRDTHPFPTTAQVKACR